MKKQIYNPDPSYSLLHFVTNFATRCHYGSITIRGRENLPQGEPYILAPCHQQALMDPLVLLTQSMQPVVFLARADVFRKPTVLKILTWLKMMPVYRIRDGKESLGKNEAIFDRCREVLLHGMPLCLMAEGRHNNKHQLLPLVKGMFRIAGETQQALGERPLYIVPVGLDYDAYEETYSHVVMHIGKPIDVRPFMAEYGTNEPVALNQMRNSLAAALKGQMHHIASSEHYEAFELVGRITLQPLRQQAGLRDNGWGRFQTRRQTTALLDKLEQAAPHDDPQSDPSDSPQSAQALSPQGNQLLHILSLAEEYQQICRQLGLSIPTATHPTSLDRWLAIFACFAALIAGCCYSLWVAWGIVFALICFPLTVIPTHLLAHKIIKDPQFRSTANFGIRYGFSLVYNLILFVVVWCCCGIGWAAAAMAMMCLMARLSGYLVRAARFILQECTLAWAGIFHTKKMARLKAIQQALAAELSQLHK